MTQESILMQADDHSIVVVSFRTLTAFICAHRKRSLKHQFYMSNLYVSISQLLAKNLLTLL